MTDPGSFAGLLRAHRIAANLTQEALAERSGLSVHGIGMLERGVRRDPRAGTIDALARALGLDPPARAALVRAARGRTDPHQPGAWTPLPVLPPVTRLIGRERLLAHVRARLSRSDVRMLTLTGPPGSGKTRLAIELAGELQDHYRDGVAVVPLAALTEPGLVMSATRQALGLREIAGQPALDTLSALCRERELLLVLDNFEHLLAAGPELAELVARCPELRVLVTSRAALRVRAEHELRVPPLALPTADQERAADPDVLSRIAAPRMLCERAEAVVPGFRLDGRNAAPVAAICRRLDGLPLALELAAPWLGLLAPDELLGQLDRRLEFLVDGPNDLPARQRTLRAALRWSDELLPEAARALLRRLSVFAGGAPLDAVEVVCQAAGTLPGAVVRHLAKLADHSLVQRSEVDAGGTRVVLLETVREYGRELLAAAGEAEVTALAHLEHHLGLTVRSGPRLTGPEAAAWRDRLGREHDNFRAALAWAAGSGRWEPGLRLAAALRPFWDYAGHRQEGLGWLERLLAGAGPIEPGVRADALTAAGILAGRLGEYELSLARLREALAISRELADAVRAANALVGIGMSGGEQGDHAGAVTVLEEAIRLLTDLDDRPLLATALVNLGVHLSESGRQDEATAAYEEALAVFRSLDNRQGTALCLTNLANRARARGRLAASARYLGEAVAIARDLGSPYPLAAALLVLGAVECMRDDVAAASVHLRESVSRFAEIGERRHGADCLRWLAWVAWRDGRPGAAARLYGAVAGISPDIEASGGPDERLLHERARAALRAELGEEAWAASRAGGSALSLAQAAAEASTGPDRAMWNGPSPSRVEAQSREP